MSKTRVVFLCTGEGIERLLKMDKKDLSKALGCDVEEIKLLTKEENDEVH